MEFVLKNLNDAISVKTIANIHFFEFEKNYYTEHDSHPFCELVFVASGEMQVNAENYQGRLNRHEMIIHRADERHSLSCPADSAPTTIIIGFGCDAVELSSFASAPTKLSDAQIKLLAEIVKEGRNVFEPPYDTPTYNMKKKKNRPFGAEQLLKNLLEHFLISLVREYGTAGRDAKRERIRSAPAIREIIGYVDDNFLEKITIDELAFLFGTNRATLCKEFRESTGVTLGAYIAKKKLDLAKKMIVESEKTFTDISAELHFETVHYFTKFFKKHTGRTPKEFRRESART